MEPLLRLRRWRIAALALTSALVSCARFPMAPQVDPSQSALIKSLESESELPALVKFGRAGTVSALAGAFPLEEASADAVSRWLLARREIFGIGTGHTLRLSRGPDEAARTVARSADRAEPSDPASFTKLQSTLVFDVMYRGFPHSGMQIVATLAGGRPLLIGVLNTFQPAANRERPVKFSSEESAWRVAEAQFGAAMTRIEASQVWFDPSWALQRTPGTLELHWRLVALDAGKAPQYAFVRASDLRVSFATPLVTRFAVHQTHKDVQGNVLWDSQTLSNGCTAGSAGCSGTALSESLVSRDVFPRVVDLWYTLTTPGGVGPFVWPFSGPRRAPFDNQGGAAFSVIVANPPKFGMNVADTPTRDGLSSTYNFPEGTMTSGFVGHEYGHVLLQQLKFIHPGNTGASPQSPAAAFTEAMADFVGMVTKHRIAGGIPAPPSVGHWMTDFSIGDFKYDTRGSVIDSPPVAWDMREGDCQGAARARIGRAFINAWGMDVQMFGSRPASVGEATYRAWWIDIMRSFALLPDFSFPTSKDFYDATVSRSYSYDSPSERAPMLFLKSELEKLGLDAQGCH